MRIETPERIYNSRIHSMLQSRCRSAVHIPWLVAFLLASSFASPWQPPAEQLARKIAAVTGPGAIALDVQNRSHVSRVDAEEARRQLLTELAALGLHFVSAEQAAATVQITLSEAEQNYVWVAEIRQGNNEPAVVMVSIPQLNQSSVERQQSAMTIKKTSLWSDQNRILDVALMNGNPQHMIVLEPESILIFSQQSGHWQVDQTLPIVHPQPWPRDVRGRLFLRKDHLFDAYLPGVVCRSSNSAPLAMGCKASDDPWPLANESFSLNGFYATSRNFFTGVLSPGIQKQTTVAPFYSSAPLPRDKYTLWLFAATTGQLHLLDGITDQIASSVTWGSNLASVHSTCGSGWQVLADANENSAGDRIKAFEFPDREPVEASEAVEFGGEITALWTGSDGMSAIAVSQDRESGFYEAFQLSIHCGQ